jgi:hypothetical protein
MIGVYLSEHVTFFLLVVRSWRLKAGSSGDDPGHAVLLSHGRLGYIDVDGWINCEYF